jgi:TIR domain
MADVFISYKKERRPAARHLAKILEAYGFSVWYDYALVPGENFSEPIKNELRNSSAAIVLWCSRSVQSDWVQSEASFAKSLRKFVPVKIEACDLPLDFHRDHFLDISKWTGAPFTGELSELINRIETLVGREAKIDHRHLADLHQTWVMYGARALAHFNLEDAQRADTLVPPAPLPQSAPSAQTQQVKATTTEPAVAKSRRAAGWSIAALAGIAALGGLAWVFLPAGSRPPPGPAPADSLPTLPRITTADASAVPRAEAERKDAEMRKAELAEQERRAAAAETARKADEDRRAADQRRAEAAERESQALAAATARRIKELQAERLAQERLIALRKVEDESRLIEQRKAEAEREADTRQTIIDVQSELARVGCYSGDADGSWGTKSQSALQKFADIARLDKSLVVSPPIKELLPILRKSRLEDCGVAPTPPPRDVPARSQASKSTPAKVPNEPPPAAVRRQPLSPSSGANCNGPEGCRIKTQ